MICVGLIKEQKVPTDNRVALTPTQCDFIQKKWGVKIVVEASENRCFSNQEYTDAGIEVLDSITHCDILMGIKEVPTSALIPQKQYVFFSHTRKKQPYNKQLLQTILQEKITLIDYECLEHEDGQRIIGFGFFAGVVGAHNGIWAYGKRTSEFYLPRVFECKDYMSLIRHYFGLKLPNIKIAVTGSGRVAHGIIEVMNLMGVKQVEADVYLKKQFSYPVYVHLKGAELYTHRYLNTYKREYFHANPTEYKSCFLPYLSCTDILMNGVYWDKNIPRLFEKSDVNNQFKIQVIADITDDKNGSIPINLGDQTIENPVYGIDKITHSKTTSFLQDSIDIIAVGNLPNELPRDASSYFGEQLIKYVLEDLFANKGSIIKNATIAYNGHLTSRFRYLEEWVNED